MNGHQSEAFSCLIGALKSPRKVNGYGADYANIGTLIKILPQKKLSILFSDISLKGLQTLTDTCGDWTPQLDNTLKGRHDRYVIVDDKLEVVLSSGFDHLSADSSDFMYVVRVTEKVRF